MPACLCALTLVFQIAFQNVSVEYVYSQPAHCAHGTFHYDKQEDALVFRRVAWPSTIETVTIFLPTIGREGQFPIFYCWGQATAIVGGNEIGVILTQEQRGIS